MVKLKTLLIDEGYNYIWDFNNARVIIGRYAENNNVSKVCIYKELADKLCLTEGAVKNWFTNKNGPGDISQVDTIAEYFNKNRMDFLKFEKKDEDGFMTNMLESVLESSESMRFSYDTLLFMEMLNELAKQTESGFIPFSKYDIEKFGDGIVYNDEEGPFNGKVVLDTCLLPEHHDIVSFYSDKLDDVYYDVVVLCDDYTGEKYVRVTGEQDMCIIVENGRWYSC